MAGQIDLSALLPSAHTWNKHNYKTQPVSAGVDLVGC